MTGGKYGNDVMIWDIRWGGVRQKTEGEALQVHEVGKKGDVIKKVVSVLFITGGVK